MPSHQTCFNEKGGPAARNPNKRQMKNKKEKKGKRTPLRLSLSRWTIVGFWFSFFLFPFSLKISASQKLRNTFLKAHPHFRCFLVLHSACIVGNYFCFGFGFGFSFFLPCSFCSFALSSFFPSLMKKGKETFCLYEAIRRCTENENDGYKGAS